MTMLKKPQYDVVNVKELRPGDSILWWHFGDHWVLHLIIGVVAVQREIKVTIFVPPPYESLQTRCVPLDFRFKRVVKCP